MSSRYQGDNYHGTIKGSVIGGRGNTNKIDIHYHQDAQGFKQLCDHVAETAFHDSAQVSEQPKCHPGTRVAILNELERWAAVLEYEYPVKWLHGPAGAGKSAIQRTIAQLLLEKGLLLASFFFFRSDANRNSSARFIATIAYQLAIAIPQTRPHIEKAIENDPFVFSKSMWKQAQSLVINPICVVQQESPLNTGSQPRIIIVDGLDECNDPDQQSEILQTLCCTVQELCIPVAILIASRPEYHLRSAFDFRDLNNLSSRIALDDSYNPDADIKKYFEEKFDNIRKHHPMKSSLSGLRWPSPAIIDTLVAKASGQFIYASTVEKFINSPRHNPAARLDVVLGARGAGNMKPFEQLDNLYFTIFGSVVEDLYATLRILGALLVPYAENHSTTSRLFTISPKVHSPAHLERLFQLEKGDVQCLLYGLESLLNIGENEENIRFFHASLSDYLFDKSRSRQFWIDAESTYADLAEHYVHRLLDWQHIHELFVDNVDLFFSKAAVTPGFRSAIENCNLEKLILQRKSPLSSSLGLDYIAPTLLDAAVRKSRFVNAAELFSVQLSAFQHLIETVSSVYFQNIHLKSYLVVKIVSAALLSAGHTHNRPYFLSQTDVETDLTMGFGLSDLRDEVPPVLRYIEIVLNDPRSGCFVDGDQYADITMFNLNLFHRHSDWIVAEASDIIDPASDLIARLLPKSSSRDDLTQCINNLSDDFPLMKSKPFRQAIENYLAVCPFVLLNSFNSFSGLIDRMTRLSLQAALEAFESITES